MATLVVVKESIKEDLNKITNVVEVALVELVLLEQEIRQVEVEVKDLVSFVVRKAITRQPVPRTQNRKQSLLSNS